MKQKSLKKFLNKKVKIKIKKNPKHLIYGFFFKNDKEMCATFMRIQEFYESPKFRSKFIDLNNFYNYYKKTHNDKFTYLKDWGGFNLPSEVIKDFFKKHKFLYKKEKQFYKKYKKIVKENKNDKFYIVGLTKYSPLSTFKHEITHGIYYLKNDYRKSVNSLLSKYSKSYFKVIKDYLDNLGYSDKVFFDEVNAYLTNDLSWLIKQNKQFKKYKPLSLKLKKEFKKYL